MTLSRPYEEVIDLIAAGTMLDNTDGFVLLRRLSSALRISFIVRKQLDWL